MFDKLVKLSHYLLTEKNLSYRRYFIRSTPFSSRMNILIGPRGVGKTTTLVQALIDFANGDPFAKKYLVHSSRSFPYGIDNTL